MVKKNSCTTGKVIGRFGFTGRAMITPLTGNEMNFYDLLLPENPGTVVMDGKEYIWNTWGEILNPPADAPLWLSTPT